MKIKNIILENPESDRELFGAPTLSGHLARQELKNMDNAYVHATRQELVNHVRDLAKNQFGVKTRVSAVAKKAGARTATFWFGSGEYVAGNPDKIVHEIKAELESQGFACKFTDSGWLSVRVPEDYKRNSVTEDLSDDDLFAYRDPDTVPVRIDGRTVDMRSIRIGDILQSDYPDFVDAYVDKASFGDGTRLSDEQLDQLQELLVFRNMWEQTIMDQITSMYESDESDDDLFGGDPYKRRDQLKIFDPDALPRLDPATQRKVYQAVPWVIEEIQEDDDWPGFAENQPKEAERVLDDFENFGRYIQQNNPVAALAVLDRNAVNYDLDDSFLYVLERFTGVDMHSLVDFEDPNAQQAWNHYRRGVMKENEESDEELFGTDSLRQRLINKIYKIHTKLNDIGFNWNHINKDSMLYKIFFVDSYFLDEVVEQASITDLRKILEELLYLDNRVDDLDENAESDEELFGTDSLKSSLIASMNAEANGQGEGGDDPEYTEYAAEIRNMIKKDFMLGAAYLWNQASQGDGNAEQFINGAERRGINIHRIVKLLGLDDDDDDDADLYNDMGIYRRHPQFESLFNEKMNLLTEAELAEPDEPERKAKTQTKDKPRLDPNMFAPKADQPLARTDPLDDLKKNAGVGGDKPEVNIKKASQADTLKKTSGIGSPEMGNMLSRMRNIDIDPDLAGYPEPEPPETLPSVEVNNTNLPAVAGQALQAAGVQNPDFHQVANLPGNMQDMIRQLGKSLFGALTVTPTKRIHVVANLGGQGPNTTQEVNAVAGFLKEHGEDLGPGDIDFDNVMPGYSAQTHMFNAAGIRWMLVKDFAGAYIYCWPEEDSVDASPKLSNNTDTKQLR